MKFDIHSASLPVLLPPPPLRHETQRQKPGVSVVALFAQLDLKEKVENKIVNYKTFLSNGSR